VPSLPAAAGKPQSNPTFPILRERLKTPTNSLRLMRLCEKNQTLNLPQAGHLELLSIYRLPSLTH
jgi:hypothetical protein